MPLRPADFGEDMIGHGFWIYYNDNVVARLFQLPVAKDGLLLFSLSCNSIPYFLSIEFYY